jgi:uncharacterized protein YraI
MRTKISIPVLILFLLLASCNLQTGQMPIDAGAVGTAVELTAAARLTEIAGSVTPTFTVAPTLTFTPTSSIPAQCNPLVTANVNANVRSGPDTAYDVVGSLTLGQTATIVGRNDAYTWWYIAYPGVGGGHAWIAGSVVTSACVPSAVQVVAAPALPTAQPVVASSDDSDDDEDDSGSGSGSSALPDLVANGMQTAPNPATQGEIVYVQVRVTNRGDAAAGSFTVQWWATHALAPCSWPVSSLAPGQSKALSCQYTYGGWNPSYDLKLVVDSENTVAESNEGNNSQSDTLNVQDAP